MKDVKKVLVVDWLDKYGGAERVIGTFEKLFSFDITYTLINIMKEDELRKIYTLGNEVIIESGLKKLNKRFRIFFFMFPYFIGRTKIDKNIDLIISSSHAIAKGVRKSNPKQVHISYFQARNFNYIWSDYKLYFGIIGYLIFPMIYILRKIDIKQSKNPDYIISNSFFVKNWVKEKYGRDSIVIYPPVDFKNFNLETVKEDFYVAVGRLVYVKRFDLVIKVFNNSDRKLIIIGDGDQYNNLQKLASDKIVFTGFLDSEQVSTYIKKAKGFIQTGVEGFGIAPLEAQACGTPVIAFGKGGVLETVIENETGVFFEEQTVESLKKAIDKFETLTFNPKRIRENALRFSKERFENEIKTFVETKYEEFCNSNKNFTKSKD